MIDHHVDLGAIGHDPRLLLDAAIDQPVVVTEKLDEVAPGLLQALQQVAGKPQGRGVARIAQLAARLPGSLIENGLDLITLAVVANDDLEVGITLGDGTEQRAAEELGVEGRNGDADEGLFDHSGRPGEDSG
ncbi:hypothetical protein D9M71_436210 [compost metagenome]